MSHLAPELINHGHPDVAFDLLSADGFPSYYTMARYGGTLWENWKNALGCDNRTTGCLHAKVQTSGVGVGSLNHIVCPPLPTRKGRGLTRHVVCADVRRVRWLCRVWDWRN